MAKILSILIMALVLLLTTGFFSIETTTRGTVIGGALAMRTGSRTVTLRAHTYRPGRTYLLLTAR